MATDSLAERLAAVPLLQALPPAARLCLAELGRLTRRRAGSRIFAEGESYPNLSVVLSGRVALEMHVPSRGTARILSLGPGELLGWSAVVGNGRMTTAALATQDTELAEFDGERLRALCASEPAMEGPLMRAIGEALARRLLATRLQLLDLYSAEPPRIAAEAPSLSERGVGP